MISKAFILGAGLGTRLRPLTANLPKPLVPFYHEPLANYALRHCQSVGIDHVAINTHHAHEQWLKHYPQSTYSGSEITFFHEKMLLDTGGGIKNIAQYIGDEPVLVYNGDILTNLNLEALISAHLSSENTATLALLPTGANCNIAVEDHRIVDIRYARKVHPGTHQFTGVYCINPEILNLIPANVSLSIIPALLNLVGESKLGAFVSEGSSWHDLGTRDSYFDAHRLQRKEFNPIHPSAHIHPSAKICLDTCVIGPHVKIGSHAVLQDTIVWPNAEISAHSQLSHCIVRSKASGIHSGKDL